MAIDDDHRRIVIVAARNEADRIGLTLASLAEAMPRAELVVADDASDDGTDVLAAQRGATVVRGGRSRGKGANMTAAAESVLSAALEPNPPTFLLCDGDLGESAGRLRRLCEAVESGDCDLAIAGFRRRRGGGLGIALTVGRRAVHGLCGVKVQAPLSGQRALSAEAFALVVPFAHGYGMEVAMTSDVVRAGLRIAEYELDLDHRATGRTPAGFVHRGRQLLHIARAYSSRRWGIG